MKYALLLLTLITSIAAQAAEPQAKCTLFYAKHDQRGHLIESAEDILELPREKKLSLKGFELEVHFSQICEAGFGAGCSDDYSFTATISKGGVSTDVYGNVEVDAIHRATLLIGDERVSMLCWF